MHIGLRSIDVTPDGRLLLNGQPTDFRGVGLHEDSPDRGSAVDNTWRDQWISDAKDMGATAIRAHYPLSPYLLELADRDGLIVWSEIPVYAMRAQALTPRSVRRAAFEYLQTAIATNQNHPSIFMWSVGNELPSRPSKPVAAYIRGAASIARHADPTRPVGIDIVGYPDIPCQRAYNRLQVIGFGNYFGWYTGPGGQLADRDLTSQYMDSLRACYPNKAIIMSEFGAEANRDGPADEKGTYAFQNAWIRFQLGVMDTKAWLSGAFYWTLREFRVRPGWDGGNPFPNPPLHQKGVETFDGQRKPAFAILQQAFQQTQQYGQPAA